MIINERSFVTTEHQMFYRTKVSWAHLNVFIWQACKPGREETVPEILDCLLIVNVEKTIDKTNKIFYFHATCRLKTWFSKLPYLQLAVNEH